MRDAETGIVLPPELFAAGWRLSADKRLPILRSDAGVVALTPNRSRGRQEWRVWLKREGKPEGKKLRDRYADMHAAAWAAGAALDALGNTPAEGATNAGRGGGKA